MWYQSLCYTVWLLHAEEVRLQVEGFNLLSTCNMVSFSFTCSIYLNHIINKGKNKNCVLVVSVCICSKPTVFK